MAGGTVAEGAAALPAWLHAVAAAVDDPASELQALVWGPRFDREHALALLARLPQVEGPWLQALNAFGERYDALPPAGQRALRQGLQRMADNAACRASC
jgi:hypothetical protein